ncbi:cathelicidin-1-like [Arapaima gigas]
MKGLQSRMFLCALLLLLPAVRSESAYAGLIADATSLYVGRLGEESAFEAQLAELQVHMSEDKSMVRKLTFPIRETVCQHRQDQQAALCPLKENGKFTMCSLEISDLVLDEKPNLTCDPMRTSERQQVQSRVRRSKPRRRCRGRRCYRPGGYSSIASISGGYSRTRFA